MSVSKLTIVEGDGNNQVAVLRDGLGWLYPLTAPSLTHALTPYPATPLTANGADGDADGSATAFAEAVTRVTVYSDTDVFLAPTEALAEVASSGAAWGRLFHPGGVVKEYPWATPSTGAATQEFWAQKISQDAAVYAIGWAE
jgi:hypothetical protein